MSSFIAGAASGFGEEEKRKKDEVRKKSEYMLKIGMQMGDQNMVNAGISGLNTFAKEGDQKIPAISMNALKFGKNKYRTIESQTPTGTLITSLRMKPDGTLEKVDSKELKGVFKTQSPDEAGAQRKAEAEADLAVSQRGKMKDKVRSLPKEIRSSKIYTDAQSKLGIVDELRGLLNGDFRNAKPFIARALARLAGEQRLTDFDVESMSGNEGFFRRVEQAFQTLKTGEFTKFNKEEYGKILNAIEGATQGNLVHNLSAFMSEEAIALGMDPKNKKHNELRDNMKSLQQRMIDNVLLNADTSGLRKKYLTKAEGEVDLGLEENDFNPKGVYDEAVSKGKSISYKLFKQNQKNDTQSILKKLRKGGSK